MRKYFLIFLIFVASISIVLFYLFRNVEVREMEDELTHIKQLSYELEIHVKNHNLLLANEHKRDDVEGSNKTLVAAVDNYIKTLFALHYNKLDLVAQRIQTKSDSLLSVNQNTLFSQERILQHNSLISELDRVILFTSKKLNKLYKETNLLINYLLISATFLLVFGLFIYIREILSAQETKRLKNELQQFVDALDEVAIVSRSDVLGRITYINNNFCKTSGYQAIELIGSSHNVVRHRDMEKEFFRKLWKTISTKNVFRAILKNRSKTGETYFVDSAIIPMLDTNDEIYEYLAISYDVTDLVVGRDHAIVAEKSKDEFLSKMSHELRTPLNSIVGFTGIMQRVVSDKKHLKYLDNIKSSSDSLLSIINDILDLSKLKSGTFSLDYHEFNAKKEIDLLLNRFDAQLELANLKMQKDLKASLDSLLIGDWLRISQIITNLLSNAIKFTAKGEDIHFQAYYEDKNLVFIVKDNGIGMSQEAQNRIFKPFEQADSSTTRRYGGTGLGLSIVNSLIHQMSGLIKLDSKEGEGSRFEVRIPLDVAEVQESLEIEEQSSELEPLNGHLLIAEDNKTNQMLISILVEDMGLSYTMVGDGVEAVERFSKEHFDLVLMDEDMPKLNGVAAMQKIKERYGNKTPFIALTANAMKGDVEQFIEAGMDGFVAKPIDNEELYRVIKSLLK